MPAPPPIIRLLLILGFVAGLAGGHAVAADAPGPKESWRGVDLSYVNELEACGATFADARGKRDPYAILADAGANVVRLRLWHTPGWTRYSTLDDVKISIRRAKAAGMKVLLDFHYSDDWVHPGKQLVPAAWAGQTPPQLAQSLGDYTKASLRALHADGLLPDYVQVGNETNTDMLITAEVAEDAPVDWPRNVQFLKAGINAVRDVAAEVGKPIGIMLHIAQPENLERWLDNGIKAGLPAFDIIGLSYYEKWSKTPLDAIGPTVARFRAKYGRDVVIVETAYPWTLGGNDKAGNLLGQDSLSPGYPATADGQRAYLSALQTAVTSNGGLGIVYWEPAWITSTCRTRWGDGSHWENATLFDFQGKLLPGAEFLQAK